jgi:hypothetical protein
MVIAATVVTVVGLVTGIEVHVTAEDEGATERLIESVITQATRTGVAICSTRELRAGTVAGKHQGWMTVETALAPSGAFSWQVLEEGGSERTREKVLTELLKSEATSFRGDARYAAALTRDNYVFTRIPSMRAGNVALRLTPRRSDPRLIDGVLTVSADGYPILLEGKLAKSPSFWVRSVSVVKHYDRFDGISLPTSVESLADVKMVGRSSLMMTYRYSAVNGRTVSHTVASEPFVGPSAEILALHASLPQR